MYTLLWTYGMVLYKSFIQLLERTRGVAALGHWWSICFGTKELVPLFCLQACEHMGVEV